MENKPEILPREELVKVVKQGIKEWMDEKFIAFGKWAFVSFMVAVFGALCTFILVMSGWGKS